MKINDKKIWVISDFHFGHKKVIEYCKRPFKNTTEMNNTLIKNYNKTISANDIVYILGDLSFLNTKSTKEIVKALKGFKFLIKGNHDSKSNAAYRKMGFMEVYDKPIVVKNKFILSHEPLTTPAGDFINIFGHIHNNTTNDKSWGYCASVEMTDYKPVCLEEIEEHCKKFKLD